MDSLNYKNCDSFSLCGREFIGKIVNIHDGDTLTAIIELFPGQYYKFNFRFLGINAPEISWKERIKGLESKYRVINFFTNIPIDTLRTYSYSDMRNIFNGDYSYYCKLKCAKENDKYGRVLANIYKDDVCINDLLVRENLACKYMVAE